MYFMKNKDESKNVYCKRISTGNHETETYQEHFVPCDKDGNLIFPLESLSESLLSTPNNKCGTLTIEIHIAGILGEAEEVKVL